MRTACASPWVAMARQSVISAKRRAACRVTSSIMRARMVRTRRMASRLISGSSAEVIRQST
jgi:hypothetical protein